MAVASDYHAARLVFQSAGEPADSARRWSHLVRPCFARKTPGSVSRSNSDVPHRSGARTCSGGGRVQRRRRPAADQRRVRSARAGTTWRPTRSSRASGGPPGSGRSGYEGPGSRAVTRNGPAATTRWG